MWLIPTVIKRRHTRSQPLARDHTTQRAEAPHLDIIISFGREETPCTRSSVGYATGSTRPLNPYLATPPLENSLEKFPNCFYGGRKSANRVESWPGVVVVVPLVVVGTLGGGGGGCGLVVGVTVVGVVGAVGWSRGG
eukprot:4994729-Pyramimonas_sp.AAC.1